MKKRIFSMLIALVMVVSLLPTTALAEGPAAETPELSVNGEQLTAEPETHTRLPTPPSIIPTNRTRTTTGSTPGPSW